MKNNLGKIILLYFITLHVGVMASEYSWNAEINKSHAYVNEAVYLKYTCEFKDRGELYVIEFHPAGEYENYDLKLLSEKEQIRDYKRINSYEYVAFIKKEGKLNFDFNVRMKKTNEDSIKNTVLGRDNTQYEEYTTKIIKQKRLKLEVTNSGVDLVGNFNIEIIKDDININAYEPYHMQIIINGYGNLDKIKSFDFKFENAKVFKGDPVTNYILDKDGYKGSWSQKFAIVSENDLEFPQTKIDYYDLKEKKLKRLNLDFFKVNVKKVYEKKELLDEIDEKKFSFKYEYLYYLLTFIAGFLVAKIKFKKKRLNTKSEKFNSKVKKAKTIDELLVILIMQNSNKYNEIIKKIEKKELTFLKDIKKVI